MTAASVGLAAEKVGVVAVALLAAGVLVARPARARALAMGGALLLTPVLLLVHIRDTPQIAPVADRPLVAAAAVVLGLAVVTALAVLLHRRPRLLPVLAVAAVPFRLPIQSGDETVNLLVPLYLVIGAGALAWLAPRLRRRDRPPDEPAEPNRLGRLGWALGAFVVLYAVQATYSLDFGGALEQVVFFYVPFAVLLALLAGTAWDWRLARTCGAVLVGLALLFAAIGFVEYATREVLFNPKVIRTNAFASYFRVNSLFFDPNIYGRFLDVAMLALATVLLWAGGRRGLRRGGATEGAGPPAPGAGRAVMLAAAGLLVLWAALLTTLSQSSFGALLVGLAVLAALRWGARWTLGAIAVMAAVAAAVVLLAPGALRLDFASPERLNEASSGRVQLVEGGLALFAERPAWGWGSAAFPEAFERERRASASQAVSASHTIPLTVAAEQGAVGVLVYAVVVLLGLWRLLRGIRRGPPSAAEAGEAAGAGLGLTAARAAVGAAFAALVFHTMLYAAFLEDPMTWTLLGAGIGLAAAQEARDRGGGRARRHEPALEPAVA